MVIEIIKSGISITMNIMRNPVVMIGVLAFVAIIIYEYIGYRKSTYFLQTGNSFFKTRTDLGKYGEYMIYKNLRNREKEGWRFLFNLYLPKGDETTEIDVLLISPKVIFVFESKNYSGWIFGDESKRMWTQTLPTGNGKSKKQTFYNPILQNQAHINSLKQIGIQYPMKSVIVFSERCTLKSIVLNDSDSFVVKRNELENTVNKIHAQESNNFDICVEKLYNALFTYTQADQTTKLQHINRINEKYK